MKPMSTCTFTIAAVSAVLILACSAHRTAKVDQPCIPTTNPLSVENGAVAINCRDEGDDTITFRCTISPIGQGPLIKSALFMFSDARLASGFNPEASNAYASWDGCSIHLRDGRVLEQVTVISSDCGIPIRTNQHR
jgi:hypothetical protein